MKTSSATAALVCLLSTVVIAAPALPAACKMHLANKTTGAYVDCRGMGGGIYPAYLPRPTASEMGDQPGPLCHFREHKDYQASDHCFCYNCQEDSDDHVACFRYNNDYWYFEAEACPQHFHDKRAHIPAEVIDRMSRLYPDHREPEVTATPTAPTALQHSVKTALPSLPARIARSEIDSLMSQYTAQPTSGSRLVARSPDDALDRILSGLGADANPAADDISSGMEEGTH